ncbi:extracellular solute-binding protein [Kitasatospora gansuensis]
MSSRAGSWPPRRSRPGSPRGSRSSTPPGRPPSPTPPSPPPSARPGSRPTSRSSPAPATAKWNIAQAPAAGNWGGSFLAVPASGKHVAQAQALAAWLTAPEQQAKVFQKVGNIPANQKAYTLPGVTDFTNPYIGPKAPTGQIFSTAAKAITPAETGPHHGTLHGAFSNGVLLMEQNHKSADEAWAATLKQITSTIQ